MDSTPPMTCQSCGRRKCRRRKCIPLTRPAWLEEFEAREAERRRQARRKKAADP